MSQASTTDTRRRWPVELPWWLRLFNWTAVTAVSVVVAHGVWPRIAIGVLLVLAAVAVQFTGEQHPDRIRAVAVVIATVAGLAAILITQNGLGYVPVVVVASRFPYLGRAGELFVVADTIAFGAAVGWATRSLAGIIAGAAIPVLAQRAAQHREIVVQRDQAEALLAEVQAGREAEAQAVALRERGRIARDLHDVLAHSLAGLSLQLQAIRAVATRTGAGPDLSEPIDKAAALARDGLAEAREAVSALRDPAGLGLGELTALVDRHPGTARLSITGTPGPVRPDASHAVYRAVQESLTNSARYAPGAAVTVALSWHPDALSVRVEDTGPAAGHQAASAQGTGLGLAGMAERIAQAGGSIRSGPRPDGPGWRVELSVPSQEAGS